MGVRGLTSFIAHHAELYLTPYELHDNNLVIDGDNLACNLYRDVAGSYSAFGGNYDDFYRGVKEFFRVLAECHIRALVIMDGGYERRKLRTVNQRMRGKIAVIKRINPNGSIPVFPILMKEVFVDAVRDSGVPVMRCVFEADDELAALGRRLNCPVLSYDSDFYIHNVQYIPLITLTAKVHLGYYKEGLTSGEPERRLRKLEAKNVKKRSKAQRIMKDFNPDKNAVKIGKNLRSYRFLDCCMYRVENLISRGSLSKEKLPLFAAILGNDYIARSSFKNFFAVGLGRTGRSSKMRLQQKRIQLILRWLKEETASSAMEKILTRLRKDQRESLKQQFFAATNGYSNEFCHSLEFFKINYPKYMEECLKLSKIHAETKEEDWEDTSAEDDEESDEEAKKNEKTKEVFDENKSDLEDISSVIDEEDEQYVDDNKLIDKTKYFSEWFLTKLYPANLPRYFVDLLHLRKYINSPQIEHFSYPECHEVALPILKYIFAMLHSAKPDKSEASSNEDREELSFSYMTRVQKISQVRFYRYKLELPLPYSFDPHNPNPLFMEHIFENTLHFSDTKLLFSRVSELPSDLRLYFLAIIYWMYKSPHYDILHLHGLIICVVVLRTIDSCIPAERDIKAFKSRFGKIVKRERQVREKEFFETGKTRNIREDLLALSVQERIQHVPKSDCFLVQEQLLRHFHMQEIFKKKYDNFSTTVLHGFSEFQSVLFQLYGLNSLLDFPFEATKMGRCFCGVFLYNIYDLLRDRVDIGYYVHQNIFRDSPLMFEFYDYLLNWCLAFLPIWKQEKSGISKKVLKKKRQLEKQKMSKQAEQ